MNASAEVIIKAIIDTDPGTDDAIALMMALNSTSVDVLAVTTLGGNATLADTTRNTLHLIEYLGHRLSVYRGASRPLQGKFCYGYDFHGAAGLGVHLPTPTSKPHQMPAPELIVKLASKYPGELAIIALGPLTNIATALAIEPRLLRWIKKLVVMGGALQTRGNITPYAEFNIYNDPVAADEVLSSQIPITLVPLDVCTQTIVSRADLPWVTGVSRSSRLTHRILRNWFKRTTRDWYDLCDPLALVAAIKPEILWYKQADVNVVTDKGDELGRTIAHYGHGSVKTALGVDEKRAKKLMVSLLEEGR